MGIYKYYECNTPLWNFVQQLVQGQHYVTFFTRQTKCYVHRCVRLGEAMCLEEVMASLYGFAKEQDATNTKKCIGGLPHNCF
jgi:hypothetical protein